MVLEDLEAASDPADFVLSIRERNVEAEVTLDEPVHRGTGFSERDDNTSTQPEGGETCDEKTRQATNCRPQGSVENDRVNIVDVSARLDGKELVPGPE